MENKNTNVPAVVRKYPFSSVPSAPKKTELAIAATLGLGSAAIGFLFAVLGIIAAGAAPLIQAKLQDALVNRSLRLSYHLRRDGIYLDEISASSENLTPAHLDLLRETVTAALETDLDEKIALLSRILQIGFSSVDQEVLSAKRFARTVARLDELEFRTAWALNVLPGSAALGIKELSSSSGISNADLVRSSLSILTAEGLVRSKPDAMERWDLTDYGRRFVAELQLIASREEAGK